ncbi:MAG: hypothetical protein RBT63_10900, partial [Bdellovibrionales bacterium]|nr:hypothetical protein [Bdellovibrionales bacterium]
TPAPTPPPVAPTPIPTPSCHPNMGGSCSDSYPTSGSLSTSCSGSASAAHCQGGNYSETSCVPIPLPFAGMQFQSVGTCTVFGSYDCNGVCVIGGQ